MIGLIFSYFTWHYSVALKELFGICKNFLWFVYHFFSIGVLGKTLFSPWQRMDEGYKKGFRIEAFFEVFIVNTIMRLLGFFVRGFVILIGCVVWLATLAMEIVVFVSWLFMPFIIVVLFISGLRLLIR